MCELAQLYTFHSGLFLPSLALPPATQLDNFILHKIPFLSFRCSKFFAINIFACPGEFMRHFTVYSACWVVKITILFRRPLIQSCEQFHLWVILYKVLEIG